MRRKDGDKMVMAKYADELTYTYGNAKDYVDTFLEEDVISFDLLIQKRGSVFDVAVSFYYWEEDVLTSKRDDKLSVDFLTDSEAVNYSSALEHFLSQVRPVSVLNEL
ncbi:hypothetical protein CN918_30275 [Priestia megaterium]|nr:hypothetical protein CN918_30275 [Priestia megaterium]